MSTVKKPILGITMGDPFGNGPGDHGPGARGRNGL